MGRLLTLTDDIEQDIFGWIQTNAVKNKTVTPKNLREHVTTHSNLPATRTRVNSFIDHRLDELCMTNVPHKKCSASRFLVVFQRNSLMDLLICQWPSDIIYL
jgi:hypothetical protein